MDFIDLEVQRKTIQELVDMGATHDFMMTRMKR